MPAQLTAADSPPSPPYRITVRCEEKSLQFDAQPHQSIRLALDTTNLRVRAACGGLGTCGACLIQVIDGEFNPPTLAERQKLLAEDLARGIRLACQLHARSNCQLYLEHPAPESVWKTPDHHSLFQAPGNPAISEHVFAVAVDLGTTYIRLSLWNRQSGRRLGTRYGLNPQVAHGADVLTRLDANRLEPHASQRMGQQARDAIQQGVRDILSRDFGEITPILSEIGQILIVGNTAMLMLICGDNGDRLYEPDNWQLPIACRPDNADEWRRAWHMPHAKIDIVQPLAGFIGSDLLADLLATNLTASPPPALLLDFGTNTEIALWDGEQLWVTSVPGGPAFEGVGMRNGMAAETGAICHVDHENAHWSLQTIDGAPARGFCASGFIDAVAALLENQSLKASGRFSNPTASHAYWLDANNARTVIYASDIDIFQRAKASTAAAAEQLMSMAGIKNNQLDTLWICGSLGQHLDLDSAFRVGLIPRLTHHRIKRLGNAGLAGCEGLLLDTDGQARLNAVIAQTKVVNFGGIPEYETCFIDHLRLKPLPTEELVSIIPLRC